MRQRTSYPKPVKAQVVQECLSHDVSIASVALRHGINANLVRKWIPIYRDRQASALSAFVPLKLETAVATPARQDVARINMSSGQRKRAIRIGKRENALLIGSGLRESLSIGYVQGEFLIELIPVLIEGDLIPPIAIAWAKEASCESP